MKIRRRDFIKRSALGAGAVLAGSSLVRAKEAFPVRFDPSEQVQLGKTKIKMSRVCMGTGVHGSQRASNQTRMGKEKFEALIQGAYERGVRAFDLADLYGTHPYLIPALKSVPRKDYVIISKIWWNKGGIPEPERPNADVVIQRFLKELGTDYIDLVLLHCVTSPKWNEDLGDYMNRLEKMKGKGIIRGHGVSCHTLEALQTAAAEPWVDSVHARVNPYGMSMDGPAEKVAPILQKFRAAGKGVVGMKIIGEGKLRNDDEKKNESVRFALGPGCVDILNVGFEKVEEIDDFTSRVRKVERRQV